MDLFKLRARLEKAEGGEEREKSSVRRESRTRGGTSHSNSKEFNGKNGGDSSAARDRGDRSGKKESRKNSKDIPRSRTHDGTRDSKRKRGIGHQDSGGGLDGGGGGGGPSAAADHLDSSSMFMEGGPTVHANVSSVPAKKQSRGVGDKSSSATTAGTMQKGSRHSMNRWGSKESNGTAGSSVSLAVTEESKLAIPVDENLDVARTYFRNHGMHTTDFDWHDTVGRGTFGNVKIVSIKEAAMKRLFAEGCPELPPLAIKTMIKRNIMQMDQVEHIKAEVDILASVDHPFIIGLYGVMQDECRLYLLMEYIRGGELFNLLANYNNFGYEQTQFYAAQVTLAFEYLHERKIAYRDLKPENILIDSAGNIKIADFGFAKVIENRSWTICGTPEYIAPEIIMSKGHDCGVDWWGLGILIFEMITGQPPFVHENTMILYRMIQDAQIKYPSTMDIRTKDLVRRLLSKDITRRFGCLKGGAIDIKRHKFFRGIDWQQMINRKISTPWKPEIAEGDPDNKYFDRYPDMPDEGNPSIDQDDQRRYFDAFDRW